MVKSLDKVWEHWIKTGKTGGKYSTANCKYCGHMLAVNVCRFKQHLVVLCQEAPDDVKETYKHAVSSQSVATFKQKITLQNNDKWMAIPERQASPSPDPDIKSSSVTSVVGLRFGSDRSHQKRKIVDTTAAMNCDIQSNVADDPEPVVKRSHRTKAAKKRMNSLEVVVSKLKKLAPLSLAGSWDNVGLLVEPSPPKYISKILLTNDLTGPVMEEAKDKTVDLIISYHPPIFRPLKRLTQACWKQRLLVECMENRIAVFSPHTSYDAVEGGVNDWLISAFDVKKSSVQPIETAKDFQGGNSLVLTVDLDPARVKELRDQILVSCLPTESRLRKNKDLFTLSTVKPNALDGKDLLRLQVECEESELVDMVKGLVSSRCQEHYTVSPLSQVPNPFRGAGRKAELISPITLETAVSRVKSHLSLAHLNVAKAIGKDNPQIQTVAVCAGSGSSVLAGVKADLLLSGEMGHHEVLNAVHSGSHVILCNHSNTERGYLQILRQKLQVLFGTSVDISVSEEDKEPLEFV